MAIRTLVLTVCAAGFGLWMLGPAPEPQPDPVVSASVGPGLKDFTVSNMENGSACLITRGRTISHRSRQVMPGEDCEAVWPGLAQARNWTQNEDGTVALTNDGGDAILTLGLGDGVDFESLEPSNAVLAFNALN
jgi:hypothetical protein